MARIHCRWRNICICLCSCCLCVLLLFLYVAVMINIAMNNHLRGISVEAGAVQVTEAQNKAPETPVTDPTTTEQPKTEAPVNPLFVAPGAVRSKKYGATPKIFWDKNNVAFWNQLQKAVDLHFNPILHPAASKTKTQRLFSDSLLRQSFSELSGSDFVGQSLLKLPEHLKNYVSSMSRRQYPVLTEPSGQCGFGATDERGPALLLLAIKTSVHNYNNRQAIRQSWGRAGWVSGQRSDSGRAEQGAYVRRVFLLGTDSSPELKEPVSELLHLESQHYGDILQWDIWDTSLNGTVKDVLFWSWFKDTCGQTSFVFHGDDEVFVNTPALVSFLLDELHKPQANSSLQDFMVGNVVNGGQPNRNADFEHFIPETFYKGWYPSYASGVGLVYSGLLLRRLHKVSNRVHLYPIDEVYVGMCMIRLNLSPRHHPAFLTSDFTKREEEEPCAYYRVILVHRRSPTQMLQLWDHRQRNTGMCRNVSVPLVTPRNTKTTPGERKHGW